MKKLLIAFGMMASFSSAVAQSAFEGFYGQLSTGYESNKASSLSTTSYTSSPPAVWSNPNQNFGGIPLIAGLGYNTSIASNFLLGIGGDYSLISQKSSVFSSSNSSGYQNFTALQDSQLQISNRLNLFITPGFIISNDKLAYLKAGYSTLRLQQNFPASVTTLAYWHPQPTTPFSSESKTLSGYIIGFGYKQIIENGLYGFAEANYFSYGSTSFNSSSTTSTGSAYNVSNNPSINTFQLLFGVGYKF